MSDGSMYIVARKRSTPRRPGSSGNYHFPILMYQQPLLLPLLIREAGRRCRYTHFTFVPRHASRLPHMLDIHTHHKKERDLMQAKV